MIALFSRKWLWYAVSGTILMAAVSWAGQLEHRQFAGLSYAHSDNRDFYVFIPDSYDSRRPVPMVMVLHGCNQTRETVIDEFGWLSIADRHGFIVVAPDISTDDWFRNPQCWGYWENKEIHQGRGEVEDLRRIGLQVEREWSIDPNHRHIAGLSSGGFMANAAAVVHNEYWASAGIHSGGGYGEGTGTYSKTCSTPRESSGRFKSPQHIVADMRNEMDNDYPIPVMLIHSRNDCSVGYGVDNDTTRYGGLTSNREAWLEVNGGDPLDTMDCSKDAIQCDHQKFGTTTRSSLEVVAMDGLIQDTQDNKGHYWSGGERDGAYTETRGPEAAAIFWDFFQRHPRHDFNDGPASPSGFTAGAIADHDVDLTWSANTEADLSGYRLYRNGRPIKTLSPPTNRHRDIRLHAGATYAYTITAFNEDGRESPPSSPSLIVQTSGTAECRAYPGTLAEHAEHGRAHTLTECSAWWCWFWSGPQSTAYYAAGSGEYLGTGSSRQRVLYSLDGDRFSTSNCGQ